MLKLPDPLIQKFDNLLLAKNPFLTKIGQFTKNGSGSIGAFATCAHQR